MGGGKGRPTLAVHLEIHDALEGVEAGGHHTHFHLVGHDGRRDAVKWCREWQHNQFLTPGVILEPGGLL